MFVWKKFKNPKLKLHNPMLIFISLLLADYLRHAPCMRLVQAGYERCAADYQTRIKALNEQTQVSIPIRILKDFGRILWSSTFDDSKRVFFGSSRV